MNILFLDLKFVVVFMPCILCPSVHWMVHFFATLVLLGNGSTEDLEIFLREKESDAELEELDIPTGPQSTESTTPNKVQKNLPLLYTIWVRKVNVKRWMCECATYKFSWSRSFFDLWGLTNSSDETCQKNLISWNLYWSEFPSNVVSVWNAHSAFISVMVLCV